MVFAGSSPITTTSPSSKAHQKSGPFPQPALPGFNGHTTPSDSRHGRRLRDVEAATLALDGSPPITRTTFPTCRAHYPGGSSGCACRLLPRSCSLPQMAGGSASALSLSRPAQASLTLRPAGLLNRLKAAFVTRLQPCGLPGRPARQLPDQSTTLWVESSSTSDPRLRGALPRTDIATNLMNSSFLKPLPLVKSHLTRKHFSPSLSKNQSRKVAPDMTDSTRPSRMVERVAKALYETAVKQAREEVSKFVIPIDKIRTVFNAALAALPQVEIIFFSMPTPAAIARSYSS